MKTEKEIKARLDLVKTINPMPKCGYYTGSVRGIIEAYEWVLSE